MALSVISSEAVIAAFVGAFLTYGVQLIRHRQKQNKKAEDFRRSLRAELIQMEEFRNPIENVEKEGNLSIEALLILSTAEYPFFEANQDKLSMLTGMEQVRLVRFYWTQEHFRLLAERMFEQAVKEEGFEGMAELPIYIEEFEEKREEALSRIEENL